MTGAFATEKDQLDGKEVEKVTVYLPPEADSLKLGLCAHAFVPEKHRFLSGTEFHARVYRFDPKTGLPLQRLCGCKRPLERGTHDERIDYPAPQSMPRELFTFRVPDGIVLEVNDPELGRQFRPSGETQTSCDLLSVAFKPITSRVHPARFSRARNLASVPCQD